MDCIMPPANNQNLVSEDMVKLVFEQMKQSVDKNSEAVVKNSESIVQLATAVNNLTLVVNKLNDKTTLLWAVIGIASTLAFTLFGYMGYNLPRIHETATKLTDILTKFMSAHP